MTTLKLVYTIFSAGELGQDTEGAGLGGARSWVPVFGVLNQTLLAGITQWGRMILSFYNRFPAQSDQARDDIMVMERNCVLNKVYQ